MPGTLRHKSENPRKPRPHVGRRHHLASSMLTTNTRPVPCPSQTPPAAKQKSALPRPARLICSPAESRVILWRVEGIARQLQVVEDEASVSLELSQCGGDGVGMGADDADSEAAQTRGVLGAVFGADAATVFVEGGVEDVMDGFDAPVPAIECEEALWAGVAPLPWTPSECAKEVFAMAKDSSALCAGFPAPDGRTGPVGPFSRRAGTRMAMLLSA